jgi:outer membrane biosynthesis protein TonB
MNPGCILIRLCAVLAVSAAVASAKTVPVRIEQTVEAQFPAALAFTALTSGEARVMVNIAADGQLADVMVTGYTNKAFADEAVSLLKRWHYDAATVDGQAVGVRLELQIKFVSTGRVVSLTALDATDALTRKLMPDALFKNVCLPAELDHPIEALQSVSPPHPGKADHAVQRNGTTLVDFYVDEHGRIRMPVVMETTNQLYAQASVDALDQWRFSTPTKHGKPVAVRVQQRFVFPEDS